MGQLGKIQMQKFLKSLIGFYQTNDAPWQSTDALHCRTHEVPDLEMLHINHVALFDTLPSSTVNVEIAAAISSYGNHNIASVELFCKINKRLVHP